MGGAVRSSAPESARDGRGSAIVSGSCDFQARARAWKSQEPETIAELRPSAAESAADDLEAPPKRFLLWVDGVGGFLVCLNARVTFGQAVAEGPVDVPLFAELSKLHAELFRDAEGYVL